MADPTLRHLSSLPLTSPVLLNLYTFCVVAITAALAIWGPQVLSSLIERAKGITGSSSEESTETENEDKDKEKDEKEKEKAENKEKKWKRKNQVWYVPENSARRLTI